MPMKIRRKIAGVKTKKINKAFKEVDAHMGMRHATGYFVCYGFYILMTLVMGCFNAFYPADYKLNMVINYILILLLDLLAFTFGLAFLQFGNMMIS